MIAMISLLASLIAAPALAQFGPGPVYVPGPPVNIGIAIRTKPDPRTTPRYKDFVAKQVVALADFDKKQAAEYLAALKDPAFTTEERRTALADANLKQKVLLQMDFAKILKERERALEELKKRHASRRQSLVMKQVEDREWCVVQINLETIGTY